MEDHNRNNFGSGLLITIVLMLSVSAWLFIGWLFAKAGASYRTVKIVLYPAVFFLGNLFGVMPFVCIGWVIALFTGNKDMANYVVGNASELTLLSSAFGDPITVPVWHIVVYQFFIWLLLMRNISDPLTTAIYNLGQPNSAQ